MESEECQPEAAAVGLRMHGRGEFGAVDRGRVLVQPITWNRIGDSIAVGVEEHMGPDRFCPSIIGRGGGSWPMRQ